jgi:hypothetical protein
MPTFTTLGERLMNPIRPTVLVFGFLFIWLGMVSIIPLILGYPVKEIGWFVAATSVPIVPCLVCVSGVMSYGSKPGQ